jgi:peptidoglycan/xylan/chitin deacetylase (PgdA/CDA1 family)
LILLYHRVADVRPDPWSLCVTPAHFDEHLQVLRRHGPVMRLQDLARQLKDGQPPRRAVVITFDDGYADNLLNARPLLEKYDSPATVFVVSGALGQAREFWWDELARILLEPGTLPDTLTLRFDETDCRWELGEAAIYTEADARRDQQWIAWGDEHPTRRHRLYREVWERLLPLPDSERQPLLNQMRAWAGVGAEGRPAHRALTPEEVSRLARAGLVEIGAHTVTHPRLAALPPTEQRSEIRDSRTRLEDSVGQPVQSFSYPFGRRSDYTAETVALVQAGGFACACSNFPGVAARETDRFQLPRVNAPDCDGETFTQQLRDWFDQE